MPPASSDISISALRSHRASLITAIQDLDAQLTALDTLIGIAVPNRNGIRAAREPSPSQTEPTSTHRSVRPGSLKDFVGRVLAGRGVMSVRDVTTAVRKFGYRTKNKTLATSVSISLADMSTVARVGRGRYRLR